MWIIGWGGGSQIISSFPFFGQSSLFSLSGSNSSVIYLSFLLGAIEKSSLFVHFSIAKKIFNNMTVLHGALVQIQNPLGQNPKGHLPRT